MEKQCSLFGGFGVAVQLLLGVVCCLTLLYKRHREHPRRPLNIFLLDASKQVCSALVSHAMNLMASEMISAYHPEGPCVWYFINIMLDTTVAVLISYLLFRLFQSIVKEYHISLSMKSNYYTDIPDRIEYWTWLIQTVIWVCIVVISKSALIFIILGFTPVLGFIGSAILAPLSLLPKFQLVIVMVIVPFVMNGFQFWVQDNILKTQI